MMESYEILSSCIRVGGGRTPMHYFADYFVDPLKGFPVSQISEAATV